MTFTASSACDPCWRYTYIAIGTWHLLEKVGWQWATCTEFYS